MKTASHTGFDFLKSAFGKGAVVFAFFAVALVAYAVTYPPQPNATTGVEGMPVGFTSAAYNGDNNGYGGASALCAAAYSNSHVCSAEEIVNGYENNAPLVETFSGIGWINANTSESLTLPTNDCGGWNVSANTHFGAVWNFNADLAGLQQCNTTRSFVCCR